MGFRLNGKIINEAKIKDNKKTFNNCKENPFCHSFSDTNTDHNQALDVFNAARKNGNYPKTEKSLINFDSHSDIFGDGASNNETIADWINKSIQNDSEIKDIYWVLPDWTKEGASKKKFWATSAKDVYPDANKKDEKYGKSIMITVPTNTILYRDKNGELQNEKPADYDKNQSNYTLVNFHKVTANELPSFKNKDVILSVDGDYFSNSGKDTIDNSQEVAHNASPKELEQSFKRFKNTIKEKEITPCITSMSLSPEYTPQDDHATVTKFFNQITEQSPGGDRLDVYSHRKLQS